MSKMYQTGCLHQKKLFVRTFYQEVGRCVLDLTEHRRRRRERTLQISNSRFRIKIGITCAIEQSLTN